MKFLVWGMCVAQSQATEDATTTCHFTPNQGPATGQSCVVPDAKTDCCTLVKDIMHCEEFDCIQTTIRNSGIGNPQTECPMITAAMSQFDHFCAPVKDVEVDWAKLTNFSTQVSFTGHDIPNGPSMASLNITGHVQLDLLGQRLKISASGSADMMPRTSDHSHGYYHHQSPLEAGLSQLSSAGKSELVIDVPAGIISVRGQDTTSFGHIGAALDDRYCVHAKIPPRTFPAGGWMEQFLQTREEALERAANSLPHTTADGVVTYATRQSQYEPDDYPFVKAVAKIHTNGVPISFSKENVCGPTCQQRYGHVDAAPLELTFNDWAAGAGEIETIPCAESSSTDLSAHPEVMHSVALLNALMQQLSQIPEMESLMSKLPSMSLLFEQQLQLAGHSANGKIVWRSWALALSGGVVGGVFVLVLAKAYRRMNFRSEPLLVDA